MDTLPHVPGIMRVSRVAVGIDTIPSSVWVPGTAPSNPLRIFFPWPWIVFSHAYPSWEPAFWTLCRSSAFSVWAFLSSLIFCPVNSSCLGPPGPSARGSQLAGGSAWVCLHALWSGHSLRMQAGAATVLSVFVSHLSRDRCSLLSNIQNTWKVFFEGRVVLGKWISPLCYYILLGWRNQSLYHHHPFKPSPHQAYFNIGA